MGKGTEGLQKMREEFEAENEGVAIPFKGTYASVRPHRHMCGNYRNTVTNVDASDSRCRCIGKIIARDLRLVASRLYRMAVTQPRVTCRRYIIPLFRRRPPGLHKPYKREENNRKESIKQSCRVRTRTKS